MSSLADEIRLVVEEVLKGYDVDTFAPANSAKDEDASLGKGIFTNIPAAIEAAAKAQRELIDLPLDTRRAVVESIRRTVLDNNEQLSREAVGETGMGNVSDKIVKNTVAATKTPGVEDVEPAACSDEHGLTLTERAPYGVIGAVTPSTNPIATICSNSIGMIAAGNSVVFNTHPSAKRVSCGLVAMLNEGITKAGGPANLIATVNNPTIESANEMMKHPGIALLVVTGGPGVVRAAIASGKKAICAGPGNPPAVVDETADIEKAAEDLVNGSGFDHNIVCITEKEILAVETIADRLKGAMQQHGAFLLNPEQTQRLTELVIRDFPGPGGEGSPNKSLVGKSPSYIAKTIGLEVPPETKILLCEVNQDHALVWSEQLMPMIPLVRMRNVDEAIDFAVKVEHGFRHTATMHSNSVANLSKMARVMNCSLFVKNGPCYAGLGHGGAGHTSFTIASPTGEGLTRARTFTRERRCTLVDAFRIV